MSIEEGQQRIAARKNTENQEKSVEDEVKNGKERDELAGKFEILWQSENEKRKARLEKENKGINHE